MRVRHVAFSILVAGSVVAFGSQRLSAEPVPHRFSEASGGVTLRAGKIVPVSGIRLRTATAGAAAATSRGRSAANASGTGVVLVTSSIFGPFPANEPAIAVDPLNSDHLIASSNDYRFGDSGGGRYTALAGPASFDDVNGVLQYVNSAPYYYNSAGDPAVGIDRFGIDYFSVLAFDRGTGGRSAVLVGRSLPTELGKMLNGPPAAVDRQPAGSPIFDDKDSFTVDNGTDSSFAGSLYSFFTQFGPTMIPIVGSYSRNQGAAFSSPVLVSTPGTPALCPFDNGACADDQGSSPAVGPHGYVYVAYENFDTPSTTNQILISVSKDGGATFSAPRKVADDVDIANPYGTFRVNSFPNLAVNRATGRLYVTWSDARSGSPVVYVSTSAHGIEGPWSRPAAVNGVRYGAFQFFPAIAVSAATGDVYLSFYDNFNHPGSDVYDYDDRHFSATLVARSPVMRVSQQPIVPAVNFRGTFVGDYTSAAIRGAGAQVIWTGTSTGKQDIETAFVR